MVEIKSMLEQTKAEGTTLEVYDPTGAIEIKQLYAPRLANLNGKTICELWNGGFEGHRTFPVIRELLKKRFPTVKVIPYTEFGVGRAEMESEQTMALLGEKGCDAVITGNAG